MLWLINGQEFKHNFDIRDWDYDSYEYDNIYNEVASNKLLRNFSFYWKYARRSWEDIQRNVFIDFGGDSLFWVTLGLVLIVVKGNI